MEENEKCPHCGWTPAEFNALMDVVEAARALVRTAKNAIRLDELVVDEEKLVALESSLEAAGYGDE